MVEGVLVMMVGMSYDKKNKKIIDDHLFYREIGGSQVDHIYNWFLTLEATDNV